MSLDNVVTLTAEAVMEIHDEVLTESGGLPGMSPDKSLEAALYRIENHAFYGGVTGIFDIAALYGIAIAQGHVFNDANKRTAFLSMITFLDQNGFDLIAPPSEVVDVMVDVAEDRMAMAELSRWLKVHSRAHS